MLLATQECVCVCVCVCRLKFFLYSPYRRAEPMSLHDTVTVILIVTVIGVNLFFTVSGVLWQLRCTDKCLEMSEFYQQLEQ